MAAVVFEDYFPSMVEAMGIEGLIEELCKGFLLLADADKGVITFDSLKRRSSSLLGLPDMGDDELACMICEGDLDGDGALDQTEFCVLMFRLSPALMELSRLWMQLAGAAQDRHQCAASA